MRRPPAPRRDGGLGRGPESSDRRLAIVRPMPGARGAASTRGRATSATWPSLAIPDPRSEDAGVGASSTMPARAEKLPDSLASKVRTSQGLEIPWVGLGVFQSPPGAATRAAVTSALGTGYRLIDTAALYGNEEDVGVALRTSKVPRDEVVVTTKLWHSEHGFEPAQAAARKSLERLGLDRIDLYLIHWPQAKSPEDRLGSWRALEKLQREGVCRSIGVSNYTVRHLEELRKASNVVPAVNQVEFHPFVYDPDLLRYCRRTRHTPRSVVPAHPGAPVRQPRAARGRRRGPPNPRAGAHPLGPPARGHRASQIDPRGPDPRERPGVRFLALGRPDDAPGRAGERDPGRLGPSRDSLKDPAKRRAAVVPRASARGPPF